MKNNNQHQHRKFLEFNGKTIYYLDKDGQYWIAIRPICEALNVGYTPQYKAVKRHKILGDVLSVQTMHDASGRLQKMVVLPEKYIYGWIFQIKANSPDLIQYQRLCYEILYDHFHGAITNRKELLLERNTLDTQINKLKKDLRQSDANFKRLHELEQQRKNLSARMNSIDKEIINQLELFDQ